MNGVTALLILLASFAAQAAQAPSKPTPESFIRFLFCHDFSRGPNETQCVELNPGGIGTVRFKVRDVTRETEEIEIPMTLSKPAFDRFAALLVRTRFLADGARYESKKKVVDLGKKRLVVDTPSGHAEAAFNYTELKEVRDLTEFLEDLIAQEKLLFSIETALKYQRLSIPEKLDYLAGDIESKRIVDPERVAAAMDKLQADSRVLDSAREQARRISKQLLKMKQ